MTDFFNSLLETSKERIKNPLIGSFIFVWFIFNWKLTLLLLFSDETIENKIFEINGRYINIYDNLIFPVGLAIFYIVILPYIMWGLEELYMKAKSERLKNKMDEELLIINNKQKTTRAKLQLEDIKADLENKKADYRKLSKLNSEIKSLEDKNERLEEENNRLEKVNDRQEKDIEDKKNLLVKKDNDFEKVSKQLANRNIEASKQLGNLTKTNQKLIQKEKSYQETIQNYSSKIKELSNKTSSPLPLRSVSEAERIKFGFEYNNDFKQSIFGEGKVFEDMCLYILGINPNYESIEHYINIAIDKKLIYEINPKKFGFTTKGGYFWEIYLINKLKEDFTKTKSLKLE